MNEANEMAKAEGMVDLDSLRELVALHNRVQEADKALKELKAKKDELEAMLLPQLEEAGVQRLNIDGRTIYRSSTWRASVPADCREAVCAQLRAMGLGDLVTEGVNAQTLSAKVREWLSEEDGEGIPAPIADLIKTYEDKSLRILAS